MPRVTNSSMRDYLSFSQVQLAAQCGEAYRRKYVLGDPADRTNVPALMGSAFHAAVEQWESIHFRRIGSDFDWASAQESLTLLTRKKVTQMIDEHHLVVEDIIHYGKQDLEWWRKTRIPEVAACYLEYRQEEIERGGFDWYGSTPEDMLEVQARCLVGGFPFLAVADMLFHDSMGRLVLRDLKTGEAKPYHAMQLEQYRVAVERCFGITVDYGQILYVKRKKPFVQVVKWELNHGQVDELTARLRSAVENDVLLVSGPFTGHCAVCDFRPDCVWGNVTPHGSS